jgi:hypothetical protein
MSKNGILIIRIRAEAAEKPQTEDRVTFELAVFLRDEGLRLLEQVARPLRLRRLTLNTRLRAVAAERLVVERKKRETLKCTRYHVTRKVILAMSEKTRQRVLEPIVARLDRVERLREKLRDLVKRAEVELRVLDEERRSVMQAFYRQIARHVETRSHRRARAA